MQQALFLDQKIFLFLNHLPHPGFAVELALFLSGIGAAGIIWFVIGAVLFLREEEKDHRFFIPIVLTGAASWILVEDVLKILFNRPRPTAAMGAWIFSPHLTDASFPSGHATIAWAMAIVLSRYEPRLRWWFYLLALSISFSRIYLGVHYPLDIVGGAFLGWGIARISLSFVPVKRGIPSHSPAKRRAGSFRGARGRRP